MKTIIPAASVHTSPTSPTHPLSHIEAMVGDVTKAVSATTTGMAADGAATRESPSSAIPAMPDMDAIDTTASRKQATLNVSTSTAQHARCDDRIHATAEEVDTQER